MDAFFREVHLPVRDELLTENARDYLSGSHRIIFLKTLSHRSKIDVCSAREPDY